MMNQQLGALLARSHKLIKVQFIFFWRHFLRILGGLAVNSNFTIFFLDSLL